MVESCSTFQVMKTQKDSLKDSGLALDFRFAPNPSRRGPRTAWGGQIGTPLLVGNSLNWELSETAENELPYLFANPADFERCDREQER